MSATISTLLRQRGHTLAVAESCTGGGLAYELTKTPGASRIFLGGVVAYANSAKTKLLAVPEEVLHTHTSVSEPVALLMAQNVRQLFGTTWALSTTGFSGPEGGSTEAPVGCVWIGLCGPATLEAHRFIFAHIGRQAHRRETIKQALALLAGRMQADA